jgi:AraC-like DNA-binding protein
MAQQESKTEIRWLASAKLPGVEFLFAENDRTMWHYFHERYAFAASEAAYCNYRYRGKEGLVYDGTTLILEPSESHRNLVVHRPQSFRVLFIDPTMFDNAGREHGLSKTPHFSAALVDDPHLQPAIYRCCESIETQQTILEQQSRLAVCMHIALRHAEQSLPAARTGDGHRTLQRVKTYLEERFNQAVSLDELSSLSGLSPFHLLRSFAKHVGLPPHAYQIHVRVERGRMLLRAGATPAEAASSVGFADQSHFTRHFRRIMKITPALYAQSVA